MNERYGVTGMLKTGFSVAPTAASLYLFTAVAGGFMPMLRTLATALFIDTALHVVAQSAAITAIIVPILFLASVIGVDWLLGSAGGLCRSRVKLSLRRELRARFTDTCAGLAYRYVEDPDAWDLITRVTKAPEDEYMGGIQALTDGLKLAISVLSVIGLIVINVWWAALVTLAFSIPLMCLAIRAGKENYQAKRDTEREERMQAYLVDTLLSREGAEERALFGYSPEYRRKYRAAFERAFAVRFKTDAKWFFRMKLSSLLFTLISVLIALTLVFPVARGEITIGLFTSLVAAAFSLVQSMSWSFTFVVDQITAKREYMKDVEKFFALPQTAGATDAPAYPPVKFSSLEIRNLSFAYPGGERRVIDGLNFSVAAGEHVAFVGVNGAGKTTLIKLLCGLYTNYEGEILINGRELRAYSQAELKSLYAIVFQDFARYELTVGENVTGGLPGRTPGAARAMGVDLDPDTPLGKLTPESRELSGGQWQRLAIARALANPAPVRILDEPTSALDPVAESEVYESFRRESRGVTTLFISHRLGSTKLASRICVLADGKILESGAHESLMEKGGVYAQMFEAQREWYE